MAIMVAATASKILSPARGRAPPRRTPATNGMWQMILPAPPNDPSPGRMLTFPLRVMLPECSAQRASISGMVDSTDDAIVWFGRKVLGVVAVGVAVCIVSEKNGARCRLLEGKMRIAQAVRHALHVIMCPSR